MYLNVRDAKDKEELAVAPGDERLLAELERGAHVALVGESGKEEAGKDGAEGEPYQGVEDEGHHGLRAVNVHHPQAVANRLLGLHADNIQDNDI